MAVLACDANPNIIHCFDAITPVTENGKGEGRTDG
jgi:hypothetical protein